MQIDRLQSLIAVLITFFGVLLANSATEPYMPVDWLNDSHRQNNQSLNQESQDWFGGEEPSIEEEVANHRWLSGRRSQEYLQMMGGQEDCCPSQMEMIEPKGGSNPDGLYVELFSDGADRQRFYEVSCKPGVEGKPCLFMERKLHNHSVCVQRYSYSYAIVREENGRHHHHTVSGGNNKQFSSLFPSENNVWKLDYIKVRSGCTCMVQTPKKKQKQRRKLNKKHQ
ncbi:uncharacterized protein LOC126900660 [Daktulosphaira vitifoliae]|uniref:uncharacterized protein LOC126900660 n=1 Tax=Daktulosphaira vitifoliae TaxID=58002 RepID=UPI0021A9E0E6|nr:uncharacterized protein LOC126900660 [Daktulosphaira vitifoliae]XP_050532498.1 uncharacterized protein LOC126900660 [Daktulosphaira vitifoliae]XP_050532499.1 uncharacterized protein LOC126900660 [Daktulosphaira vitifoliae]